MWKSKRLRGARGAETMNLMVLFDSKVLLFHYGQLSCRNYGEVVTFGVGKQLKRKLVLFFFKRIWQVVNFGIG